MTTGTLKAPALQALKSLLAPLGYRKSGNLFSKSLGNVVHLIELQGSRQSTAETVKFTVNVGVFALDLVYPDVRDTTKPSIPLAHWRQRIGTLSPEQQDIWWTVSNQHQAEVAARDIATRVGQFALPRLAELPDLEALVSLWQSGRSSGVTEYERKEFLSRLGRAQSASSAA